jgi:hypothetical protein
LLVRTADAGKLKFSSFDDLVGHEVAVIEPTPDSSEHPLLSPELWKFLGEHHNMVEASAAERPDLFQSSPVGVPMGMFLSNRITCGYQRRSSMKP